MPSAVRVIFNADTGQYVASVDQATGAVTKQAEAVALAKNRILAALREQNQAAKASGASAEEYTRIQTKAAEGLANVTEKNANKVIAALDRVSEKRRRVSEELKNLGDDVPSSSGGSHGVTDRQKISALARGGGLRASENFLTQFDFANKLAGVAFPVLGAAALAKEVVKGVVALKEMYDAAQKLPAVIREAFDSLNLSMRTQNDELDLSNAKLEREIATLEKKPANNLKIALMESRVEADKLAQSLANDAKAVNELIEKNKSGALSVLMGKGSTASVNGSISSFNNKIEALGIRLSELQGKGDTAGVAKTKEEIKQTQDAALSWSKSKLFVLDNPQYATQDDDILSGADNSNNRNTLLGFQGVLLHQKHRVQSEDDSVGLNGQRDKDEAAKSAAEAAKEAQRQRQEASRQAMEAQRKQWASQDDGRKDAGTDSPLIEVNTWALRLQALKVGSEQYLFAKHELAEKLATLRTADAEAAKKAAADWEKNQRNAWDLDHDAWVTAAHRTAQDESDYWAIRALEATKGSDNERAAWDRSTRALLEAQKQHDEATKAGDKGQLNKKLDDARVAEGTVSLQLQTGQISKHDAALQQAAIHAAEYNAKMADLQKELAAQAALDPESAGTKNARTALAKEQADGQIQAAKDAAAIYETTWQGALKNTNALWVQDAKDSAKQVTELYSQALNGINDNLSSLAVREKTNFSGLFQGLGKTVVGDGLKRIEAPVLSALGLAKADGSSNNPFWVKMAGGTGGAGDSGDGTDSVSNGLAKTIAAMQGGDGGGGAMSTFASFAQSALSFIPGAGPFFSGLFGGHRALGGGVKAGVSYDVGEMGRETFTPSSDGYITPNNKLGQSASYQIYMDGGVTSEQVHQQITSALKAVHPKVVRDSANAVSERMMRRPRSSGN